MISPGAMQALVRMFGQTGAPSGLDTPGGMTGFQPPAGGFPAPNAGADASLEDVGEPNDFPGLTPTQASGAQRYLDMIPEPSYEAERAPNLGPQGAFENIASFLPAGTAIPYGRQNDSGQRARITLANFLLNALGERGRSLYKTRTTREQAAYDAAQKENERKRTLYETRRTNAISAIGAAMIRPDAAEEPTRGDKPVTKEGAALLAAHGLSGTEGVPREEVKMVWKPTKTGSGGGAGRKTSNDIPIEPMTDEAMDQAARYFAITGDLPATISGAARDKQLINLKIRVGNRSSQLFPGNSLMLSRAAAKGDSKALVTLKEMQAGTESFAGAASKIGGNMKHLAARLTDTGSPLINKPFRDIMANLRGDPDLRAYLAFREGALNEYGKLITTPKISATALTVNARQHMDNIIARGATLGEVISALDALQQEGEARRQAVTETISVVEEHLQRPRGYTGSQNGADPKFRFTRPGGN